jgi:hypothetical protein
MEEISSRIIRWEGLAQLLCRPGGCRMRGHHGVDDPSTVVREDDQYEQQPKGDRRHNEEVGGDNLTRVISEESPPRL